MMKEKVSVGLKNGLEARQAALFVQIASKFESHIAVVVDEKNVNAKSIMGMMSLGTIKGAAIELVVDGEDEQVALEALAKFLTTEEIGE
ncbi:MAG: HPr family phosphocarrier protein [Niameybacter sp.]